MNLKGRNVSLWFSEEGRAALREVFAEEKRLDDVHVIDQDDRGLWILVGSRQTGDMESVIPAMLMKWSFVSTIKTDLRDRGPERETVFEL